MIVFRPFECSRCCNAPTMQAWTPLCIGATETTGSYCFRQSSVVAEPAGPWRLSCNTYVSAAPAVCDWHHGGQGCQCPSNATVQPHIDSPCLIPGCPVTGSFLWLTGVGITLVHLAVDVIGYFCRRLLVNDPSLSLDQSRPYVLIGVFGTVADKVLMMFKALVGAEAQAFTRFQDTPCGSVLSALYNSSDQFNEFFAFASTLTTCLLFCRSGSAARESLNVAAQATGGLSSW